MNAKNIPESKIEESNRNPNAQGENARTKNADWLINGLLILALVLLWSLVALPEGHGKTRPINRFVVTQVQTAPTTIIMSGKIVDENGRPLVGATVLLKGSSKGTSTDSNGNYTLEVPSGTDNVLIYGYGGYDDEIVHSRGSRPVNVTLTPRAKVSKRRLQSE